MYQTFHRLSAPALHKLLVNKLLDCFKIDAGSRELHSGFELEQCYLCVPVHLSQTIIAHYYAVV